MIYVTLPNHHHLMSSKANLANLPSDRISMSLQCDLSLWNISARLSDFALWFPLLRTGSFKMEWQLFLQQLGPDINRPQETFWSLYLLNATSYCQLSDRRRNSLAWKGYQQTILLISMMARNTGSIRHKP